MFNGKENINDGVSCSVQNCAHNCGANRCTAPVISVGEDHAAQKSETCCSTFLPKTTC